MNATTEEDTTQDRPWGPEHDLTTAVFEAVGAASMCWEHIDHAGIFDDRKAVKVATELLAYLRGPHNDGDVHHEGTV